MDDFLENNTGAPDASPTTLRSQNAILKAQVEQLERQRQVELAEKLILQKRIQELQKQSIPSSNTPPSSIQSSRQVTPLDSNDLFTDLSTSATTTNPAQPHSTSTSSQSELPPIKTYSTREEALADINKWGLTKGWGFTIGSSTKKSSANGPRVKLIIACNRREAKKTAGPPKEGGQQYGHNKSSRGTGCKFSLICIENIVGTSWELRYRKSYLNPSTGVTTDYCKHNHKPSASGDGSEHPVQRRLDIKGEKTTAIVKQNTAGSKPRGIANYPDQNSKDDNTTVQDIWNETNRLRSQRAESISTGTHIVVRDEDKPTIIQSETDTAPQNPVQRSSQSLLNDEDRNNQNNQHTNQQPETDLTLQNSIPCSSQNLPDLTPPNPILRSSQSLTDLGLQNPVQISRQNLLVKS